MLYDWNFVIRIRDFGKATKEITFEKYKCTWLQLGIIC